jgi:squalene cyclase
MQAYTPPGLEKQFQQQFVRARKWLESATPRENQEDAFRLLGLKWTDASQKTIDQAREAQLASQNDDGGWSQLPQLPSDAYATGLALYALHIGGDVATDSPEYKNGVSFLLRTQDRQGAWHVKSRSYGIQPYFESGFPYEHDQWISSAATGWATAALLLCDP